METVFANWDALGMTGGCIFADSRMMAFTYGAAVTTDTFDVCVEKADRCVEGAFAIINQQFAEHLPEQFVYLNREEDMGIEGLRKSKLSYHPEILLTYNAITIRKAYTLERMTAADAPLTIDWMVRQYGFSRAEVEQWVRTLHFNWPLSVKALDTDGQAIGLLNMSDYRIEEEVPQIATDAPFRLWQLPLAHTPPKVRHCILQFAEISGGGTLIPDFGDEGKLAWVLGREAGQAEGRIGRL